MKNLLSRITGLDQEQLEPAWWASFYIFCVLAGYYVLKPLRDEVGLLVGKDYVPKLFIWTLVVMAVVNPLFSTLMNRFTRVKFIRVIYRFFALNVLIFIGIFKYLESTGQMPEGGQAVTVTGVAFGVGVAFFLWVSVYNLFVSSIFWALMADLYNSRESKKLFGLVGAGGTLGQFAGSSLTKFFIQIEQVHATDLLFITVILLELSVFAMKKLTRNYKEPERAAKKEDRPNALSGITDILRSPFLLGICLYLFFYTFTSTFLYFQKYEIVEATLVSREARIDFFASVSMAISGFTLFIQLFLTGRILPVVGLTVGLSLVPIITGIGFVALGRLPGLMPLALIEVCRATANYGITRPSREILYTVVSRREKYLSKSFIDTFVYRGGDAIASGAFQYVKSLTTNFQTISLVAVPAAVLYLIVAIFLGRKHKKMADEIEKDTP